MLVELAHVAQPICKFFDNKTHSRQIDMLYFFNGKYMGCCFKYKIQTMSLRVSKNAYESNKILFEMITN